MFVDSHCHLNDERFQNDLDEVIARARQAGVFEFLTIGTSLEEMPDLIKLTQKYPNVSCSVGVHPHDATKAMQAGNLFNELIQYAAQEKVVGLGETGLDYYYENSIIEDQKQAFLAHIEAAKQTDLPLVIHTRDAEHDTVALLQNTHVRGVLHCFSGSQWLAEAGLDMGLYISISGIVTFKNADDLRAIVKRVPLDRLLVETDAPYLAPIPYRGKRNESAFMIETAKVVADIKGVDLQHLAEVTTANFQRLFSKVTAPGS